MQQVHRQIEQAVAQRSAEHTHPVRLLAVSKRQSSSAIAQLVALGQTAFGENYVSEALDKMRELDDPSLEWHFIGPLQSNKTAAVAKHFAWVHSVDRAKILTRLSRQRPSQLPPLNCCIQVNIGDESSKSGVSLEQLPALAAQALELPRLKLRGLMCIPPPSDDPAQQRAWFAQLRLALQQLKQRGWQLDTLSMGMSNDLAAAIAEGATMVRVGTALFGPRES